jgi:hypothetical protein
LRPIVAKYCETATCSAAGRSSLSVTILTVRAAALLGSDGIFLVRLMHPVCARLARFCKRAIRAEIFKMRHYLCVWALPYCGLFRIRFVARPKVPTKLPEFSTWFAGSGPIAASGNIWRQRGV